jgi:hypothetical protein
MKIKEAVFFAILLWGWNNVVSHPSSSLAFSAKQSVLAHDINQIAAQKKLAATVLIVKRNQGSRAHFF